MKNILFDVFPQKSKVWCWTPNIYEVFLGCWTLLRCLVSETKHLRIIFEILEPDLEVLLLETQHLRIISEILDQPIGVSVLDLRSEVKIYSFYVIFWLAPKR